MARALGDLAARDGRPVVLISGLLANKDATGFFTPFARLGAEVFAVTFEGHASAPAAQTAAAAELAGLRAHACDSLEEALTRLLPAPRRTSSSAARSIWPARCSRSADTWPT